MAYRVELDMRIYNEDKDAETPMSETSQKYRFLDYPTMFEIEHSVVNGLLDLGRARVGTPAVVAKGKK